MRREQKIHVDNELEPQVVSAIERIPEPRREKLIDTFTEDNVLRIVLSVRIPINPKALSGIVIAVCVLIVATIIVVAQHWPEVIRILVQILVGGS